MVFIDDSNFRASISTLKYERKQDRVIDYYKIHSFIIKYLSKNKQYKNQNLFHVRTYVYTGEYTDQLLQRIKKSGRKELLEETERRKYGQKEFFFKANLYPFVEIRKKPLQFVNSKGIFQKGVDVELAVDLVSNAFNNTYDTAVLFSGDVDLIESLKLVKNLGKQVIVFSHKKQMSRGLLKEVDYYIDFQKLEDDFLNEFTHIFQKKSKK